VIPIIHTGFECFKKRTFIDTVATRDTEGAHAQTAAAKTHARGECRHSVNLAHLLLPCVQEQEKLLNWRDSIKTTFGYLTGVVLRPSLGVTRRLAKLSARVSSCPCKSEERQWSVLVAQVMTGISIGVLD